RGGGTNGVGEEFGGGPGRRRGGAAVGSVEAEDGVEVDGAAFLVLGDLGERHPGVASERALAESGPLGDLTAQVDGEPSPQWPGVGVPQHGRLVVVSVRVQRCAEGGSSGAWAVPQRQWPVSGRL